MFRDSVSVFSLCPHSQLEHHSTRNVNLKLNLCSATGRVTLHSKYSSVFSVRTTLVYNDVLGPFTSESLTPPPGMGTFKPTEDTLGLVRLEGLLTV